MSRYIKHHGIKGQKWGVRRYQKKDGTLTKAGKRRYAKDMEDAYTVERKSNKYLDDKGKLNKEGKMKYNSKKEMYDDLNKEVGIDKLDSKKKFVDNADRMLSDVQRQSDDNRRAKQKAVNEIVEDSVRDRAKKMSDAELREAVNRLNMEENYTRMMANRERVEVGKSSAEKFLDVATTAVSLTSSALGIALAIKQLQG